uniref:Uncharacterized protein n=1 Tax=Ditylenchus dipsaci TaxID=166011 RepID=A0A915CV96_9BILA
MSASSCARTTTQPRDCHSSPAPASSSQQPAIARAPETSQQLSSRCVAEMPARLTHLRRYCTIFWNENCAVLTVKGGVKIL